MEFKSRFARGLPLLALVAALVVPFKPVAAAAQEPYPVNPAAPAAQMNAGNLASDSQEEDARLYRPRKPRHDKRGLVAAAEDEVLAAGRIRKPRHDKRGLIAAAQDEVSATRRLKKKA